VEYEARAAGADDVEMIRRLVLVYEGENECFERFIAAFGKRERAAFEDPSVELASVRTLIDGWEQTYFSDAGGRIGGGLAEDLFSLARHIAQDDGHAPTFFPFGVRDGHDLDAVARDYSSANLSRAAEDASLCVEYKRPDRYWNALYPTYLLFKSHYNGCVERLLDAARHGGDGATHKPVFRKPEAIRQTEPPERVKDRVKDRDGRKCLCCGYGKMQGKLQVDHVAPAYHGGPNHLDNLQTLCARCNSAKGTRHISFRTHQSLLTAAPAAIPKPPTPVGVHAKSAEWWEMFLRRTINLFYQCAAVAAVSVGVKGDRLQTWTVTLLPGNDPKWLRPHLKELAKGVRDAREEAGYKPGPDQIRVG
jgi:ATP-dependent helicase IRC3